MKEIGEIILQKLRVMKVLRLIPEDPVVLDIGCGDDYFLLKKIKNKIKEGYGLDERIKMKDYYNIHLKKFKIRKKLPFKNNFFDIITVLAVFEHLDYPNEIAHEFHRVLRPNGKVIMTLPTSKSKNLYKYFLLPLGLVNEKSVAQHRYYSKEKLRGFFSKGGFKRIRIKTFEFGFNSLVEARK